MVSVSGFPHGDRHALRRRRTHIHKFRPAGNWRHAVHTLVAAAIAPSVAGPRLPGTRTKRISAGDGLFAAAFLAKPSDGAFRYPRCLNTRSRSPGWSVPCKRPWRNDIPARAGGDKLPLLPGRRQPAGRAGLRCARSFAALPDDDSILRIHPSPSRLIAYLEAMLNALLVQLRNLRTPKPKKCITSVCPEICEGRAPRKSAAQPILSRTRIDRVGRCVCLPALEAIPLGHVQPNRRSPSREGVDRDRFARHQSLRQGPAGYRALVKRAWPRWVQANRVGARLRQRGGISICLA